MTEYQRTEGRGGSRLSSGEAEKVMISIMTPEEFKKREKEYPQYREMVHSLGSIRYSRAEICKDCIQGVFRIPAKSGQNTPYLSFGFYMEERKLTVIEEGGRVKECFGKMKKKLSAELSSPDQALLFLVEYLMENDILYLQHMEEQMSKLETALLEREETKFLEELLKLRKKMSEFRAYYGQMIEIGELMESGLCEDIIKEPARWKVCIRRAERLQNFVNFLQEYAVQLRELYQSKLTEKQNQTMSILTVVTTLFLPLTLFTGWYGMNFSHMPELQWKYGYPAAFLLVLLIAAAEIIYFRKKRML